MPAQSMPHATPTVLLHGFLGWDRAFYVDYFYQIPETLKAKGYDIHVVHVAPINSIEFRSKQLATQIDAVLKATGAAKVNLIAHSMGGMDARHLISILGYGDRVASLTTIATPHRGSPVADLALGILGLNKAAHDAINDLLNRTTSLLNSDKTLAAYGPIDLDAALNDLSVAKSQYEFDPGHPDVSGVFYQSYGGVASFNHQAQPDLIDPILHVLFDFIKVVEGDNDGMVSIDSARHGEDRGTIPTDHLDEIGQLLGRKPVGFEYKDFYVNLMTDLVRRGY